jgi:branched-chain amino acid transport system substrate-binding protein
VITRRAAVQGLVGFAALSARRAGAQDTPAEREVRIGLALSLTGGDSEAARRMQYGVQIAIEDANLLGAVPGVRFTLATMDDATAAAGEYDPARAAENAKALVGDATVVALVGPQMSGAAQAMMPTLARGGLAAITPSATAPALTAIAGPDGRPVLFRMVTTDDHQGPDMANFYSETLRTRAVAVLDDGGSYGIGIADAFQAQAGRRGMQIPLRERLDPRAPDYRPTLQRIRASGADALYYGGVLQAGVKLAQQAYEIIPTMVKGGGDGMVAPEMLTRVGFPAAEGWYATVASPHVTEDPRAHEFVTRYQERFKVHPDDYAITAYDAALVVVDAVRRVVDEGQAPTRAAIRAAIAATRLDTLQGMVTFDERGELSDQTISVFQIRQNIAYPLDDILFQYAYVGVAPRA